MNLNWLNINEVAFSIVLLSVQIVRLIFTIEGQKYVSFLASVLRLLCLLYAQIPKFYDSSRPALNHYST